MVKAIFYSLILFYIINLQIQIIITIDTCSPAYFCDECQYCGEETKTYDSCSYYNMLCRETKNTLKYSSYFKNEYINYFNLDYDSTSFCGSSIYYLKYYSNTEKKKEILIFSSENKNLINMHCHFYIDLENSYVLNPRIIFEKIRYDYLNENNYLKYQISTILTYNNQVRSQSIETFAGGDIGKGGYSNYEIVLDTASIYEFFVDFSDNNYIASSEILRIKITFDKKYEGEIKGNEGDESSISTGEKAGICIGSIILFLIICCCCCRK